MPTQLKAQLCDVHAKTQKAIMLYPAVSENGENYFESACWEAGEALHSLLQQFQGTVALTPDIDVIIEFMRETLIELGPQNIALEHYARLTSSQLFSEMVRVQAVLASVSCAPLLHDYALDVCTALSMAWNNVAGVDRAGGRELPPYMKVVK